MTSKFDRWACKTIGHIYLLSYFKLHFIAIWEFKMELQSGNTKFGSKSAIFFPGYLEILQVTLKNNRTPVLCYFKLCASFHSHTWIQSGVTVRKRPLGFDLCDLALWALTLTFCIDITFVIGNHSWNFMMIRWWEDNEKCVTDGRRDGQTDGKKCS